LFQLTYVLVAVVILITSSFSSTYCTPHKNLRSLFFRGNMRDRIEILTQYAEWS